MLYMFIGMLDTIVQYISDFLDDLLDEFVWEDIELQYLENGWEVL